MNELLLEALETFPNFVVIGADERIVYLNEGYARLLGATARPSAPGDRSHPQYPASILCCAPAKRRWDR